MRGPSLGLAKQRWSANSIIPTEDGHRLLSLSKGGRDCAKKKRKLLASVLPQKGSKHALSASRTAASPHSSDNTLRPAAPSWSHLAAPPERTHPPLRVRAIPASMERGDGSGDVNRG